VERIDTHGAVVFVAGDRAWKLKRAVRYDYMDFSTAERRRACCEAEVRLNGRTASGLYLGVVPVTREPGGGMALGGTGVPEDWVVEMRRFDQDALLDRLATAGRLDLAVMDGLAAAVARFHEGADVRRDRGGRAGMAWVIDGNAAGLAEFGDALDAAIRTRVVDGARAVLDAHGTLLDRRCDEGFVRQCHGDLHLRNIVLLDGAPTLFDAIEFNDAIACVDTLYDLAFLLMDLWHRALPRHANAVWNGYLRRTDALDGLSLLPLFLSCRAAVRAKTSATAASLAPDAAARRDAEVRADEYLALADTLLTPPAPALVTIGGFSGAGKSTLARALAPGLGAPPGAVVLRSDEIRKTLAGVDALDALPADTYPEAASVRTYEALMARAAAVLEAGHAVVLDAVFARPGERDAAEGVARRAGVPFAGLWLDAPADVLAARVETRAADASDARGAVVRAQVAHGAGGVTWQRVDAAAIPREVEERAAVAVRGVIGQGRGR
jgi:aminoglycoside phosphotransferase family enzyme/predicted kinase